MTIFYSPQTRGFYVDSIHGESIPDDRIEVSEDKHWELLVGQQEGGSIVVVDGKLVLQKQAAERTTEEWERSIAHRRYAEEVSGVEVAGTKFETTRESQSLMGSALVHAMDNPDYTCLWKTASGFKEMSVAELRSVLGVVRSHVQACFDREAALLDHLKAGTLTEHMLDQGWPS
ncbi:DUF4376 domain-containing protein [Pseudomonas sp. GCEP-101]|uniref:DUF4376 domain-containing protein n=1 Tax=Pseudomonas sp. GCEP-101 TaxID=2974552 RepID=UPI00223BB537|nr:DUF4376 domain-containing protein [Pseudomonas sp. GCEP-101]